MIYAKNFNLIHFPKTGGTWIRRVCEKLPQNLFRKKPNPRHFPFSQLSNEDKEFPTFIFVRNPWDWYVSLYGHRHRNIVKRMDEFRRPYAQLDAFHKRVYDRFCGSFEHSLQVLSGWEPWEDKMGVPLRWMSDRFDYMIRDDARHPNIRYEGVNPDVTVFRYEDISPKQGLIRRFEETGRPLRASERQALNLPPQNVGARSSYRQYYCQELRELVQAKDRNIIDRFGYEF